VSGQSSKNPYRFPLDLRSQGRAQTFARAIIDLFAQPLPQQKIDIHELVKTKLARSVLVYEDVDIGIGSRLVPRMRAEQVKRLTSARANIGSAFFDRAMTSLRRMSSY
jgi:hypothetical protein